jgi:hypothetical protein
MKKVVAISLIFLFLSAISHISVATHFCCGNISASKISLSGKLATCGMESDDTNLPIPGSHFSSHCCDNILVFCGINSIFFPSFSFVTKTFHHHIHIFSVPAGLDLQPLASIKSICTNLSPPGPSASNTVELSDICVYRI